MVNYDEIMSWALQCISQKVWAKIHGLKLSLHLEKIAILPVQLCIHKRIQIVFMIL